MYTNELAFERDLLNVLFSKGWQAEVLKNKTEEELIENWRKILSDNNNRKDCLNNYELTDGEMQQILNQITALRTPAKLNGFINGKCVNIVRDNPDDIEHLGKTVSLNIYDRQEIAAGSSRYQIAEQPKFHTSNELASNRRGDFMLLINGMPLIHVELKKSNISVSQAAYQIQKYAEEGIFSQGIFSLVQIFVAMNPEETIYFANPGPDGKFNSDFYFHWADFNNEPINDWKRIASEFLSIPMAHQLIGFYTVPDKNDDVLKIMRSYQYYATTRISDKVAKTKWGNDWQENNMYGGYIWHTTGSGKTLTSFKAAHLISTSKDADKVVFLVDRIELGTQTHKEYVNFADDDTAVQDTQNGTALLTKLKSDAAADTLIVTSIQKMSNIQLEEGVNQRDIETIRKKRLVFIIDECHRDTFGDMLANIRNTFPQAVYFGFTGTPIFDVNQKKMSDTSTVFGDELHRYSIACGIRDKNVLGFDPYKVMTYKESDLRNAVALEKAKAKSIDEVFNDKKKTEVYYRYMNDVPMAGVYDEAGKYNSGIEDLLPDTQYSTKEHHETVVNDIVEHWTRFSVNKKFHAILATSSIEEAVEYFKLFKDKAPHLKVTALYDPSIDNKEGASVKEKETIAILEHYNKTFGQFFTMPSYALYKKDVAARLAHKDPYNIKDFDQLDLLIVVDQMLTGFDSKWINTLYLDKVLKYEGLIQAFSRTNRLYGHEKPFGTIRYYRKPFTMERNIKSAFKLYSGDREFGLWASKLAENLQKMNEIFAEISNVFEHAGVQNFEKLPDDVAERGKFAKLFKMFNDYLDAAKIQQFVWDKQTYKCDGGESVTVKLDETTYLTLAQRYKELYVKQPGEGGGGSEDIPYDITTYLTEINTDDIDANYMNSKFKKYMVELKSNNATEQTLNELHKTFAMLSQEEQKVAQLLLHEIQAGYVVDENKNFRDLITERIVENKNTMDQRFAEAFGIDVDHLRIFLNGNVNEVNINEFEKLDKLLATVDLEKASAYFEKKLGEVVPRRKLKMKIDAEFRKYILKGRFEAE